MAESTLPRRIAPRMERSLPLAALVVVAFFVCLRVGRGPAEPAAGPMVGQEAPEVADEIEQWVNGDEVDLADLGGKLVLLYFWHPRDGRSPASLDHIQKLTARDEREGLVTIGLCVCDEPAEVEPLIAERRLTFRIALDSDADIHLRKYRIDRTGTPYCYLVGPDRRIVWGGPPGALTSRCIRSHLP